MVRRDVSRYLSPKLLLPQLDFGIRVGESKVVFEISLGVDVCIRPYHSKTHGTLGTGLEFLIFGQGNLTSHDILSHLGYWAGSGVRVRPPIGL